MPRAKLPPLSDTNAVKFIPSGSTLLDLVLGGGWAEGRVSNIVGDRSAGKTLLLIEQFANFAKVRPEKRSRYGEAEAAFDLPYAYTMGLPRSVEFPDEDDKITTIEKFASDLEKFMDECEGGLYGLDSLDACSDEKEQERELGEATYGTAKAKLLSEFFRKKIAKVRDRNCTLTIISQIRDKIGVTFGETKTRSGGHALDFYASQIIWLREIEKIKRTVLGADRYIGVKVEASNKKNKVGKPFRRAEFTILFNYGIDDETSMLDWLVKNKADGQLDHAHKEYREMVASLRKDKDREGLQKLSSYLKEIVTEQWQRIEDALAPPMAKYE